MHRNVQGLAPGGCKSLSRDAERPRAAPAIICITNRGYSHVALTEVVCIDAFFRLASRHCSAEPQPSRNDQRASGNAMFGTVFLYRLDLIHLIEMRPWV